VVAKKLVDMAAYYGFDGYFLKQLYDVEQERNGLMTYDRKFKFDPEIFCKINNQKAAIEE
ncbi:MAG: hypothetical protein II244_08490, partial [Clostridia bacterium]|nr:hypothetical protein [Clostridia bacterium]